MFASCHLASIGIRNMESQVGMSIRKKIGNKIQKQGLCQTNGEAMWSALQTKHLEGYGIADSDPHVSTQFVEPQSIGCLRNQHANSLKL
jgi:hypothetical protein